MKRCACGELVEDHVRFHWTSNDAGHYADDGKASSIAGAATTAAPAPPQGPAEEARDVLHRGPPVPKVQAPIGGGTEHDLVLKPAMDLFETLGYQVWQLEQNRKGESARQTPGLADLFVAGHGVTAWAECKRWDGKQKPTQRTFETAVLTNGGIYLLVYELAQISTWHRAVLARKGS